MALRKGRVLAGEWARSVVDFPDFVGPDLAVADFAVERPRAYSDDLGIARLVHQDGLNGHHERVNAVS